MHVLGWVLPHAWHVWGGGRVLLLIFNRSGVVVQKKKIPREKKYTSHTSKKK